MVDSEAPEKRPPILTSLKQDLPPPIANVGETKHDSCGCCAAFDNAAITFPTQKVLFSAAVWNQNLGHSASVEEGWLSKLVLRNRSPTDAECTYTGT